jgi:hypothetical protein
MGGKPCYDDIKYQIILIAIAAVAAVTAVEYRILTLRVKAPDMTALGQNNSFL